MPDPDVIRVTVVYAAPGTEAIVTVVLPPASTVADALAGSGLLLHPGVDASQLSCAVHGERADALTPLRDGDRVELVRPLIADPKDVRRRRAHENPLPRARPRPKRGKRRRSSSDL
jgi:hypothetical protein